MKTPLNLNDEHFSFSEKSFLFCYLQTLIVYEIKLRLRNDLKALRDEKWKNKKVENLLNSNKICFEQRGWKVFSWVCLKMSFAEKPFSWKLFPNEKYFFSLVLILNWIFLCYINKKNKPQRIFSERTFLSTPLCHFLRLKCLTIGGCEKVIRS